MYYHSIERGIPKNVDMMRLFTSFFAFSCLLSVKLPEEVRGDPYF